MSQLDYEFALLKIESLMDAAPRSTAEAELELWSGIVANYECEHFPINAPDQSVAQTNVHQSTP